MHVLIDLREGGWTSALKKHVRLVDSGPLFGKRFIMVF